MSAKFILITLALILVSITGCTTYGEARKQLIDSLPESERAYLIGKFSVQCKPSNGGAKCSQAFNSISAYYKSNTLKYNDRFDSTNGSIFGNDTIYDVVDTKNKVKSFYFCRILPEGNYSLFTIRYWNFAGGGSGYYLAEEDQFDIPFRLEKGKISLIGSLKLTTEQGKNILGMTLPTSGLLVLDILKDEEVNSALKKCPEMVRAYEIMPQHLISRDYKSPFVKVKN